MVTMPMTDPLRALVRKAISAEWHRRIAEQTADTPDAHIEALTGVVVLALAAGYAGPHPWQEYNHYGNTCHYPGCCLTGSSLACAAYGRDAVGWMA